MEIKASLKNYRMAPRKMRLVADFIRGKEVNKAKKDLEFSSKRAASPILKLLNSAVTNAQNNFKIKENEVSELYIKKIFVEESRKLKRWRPIARGSAHEIQKKTSNVIIILDRKKINNKNKTKK